MDSKEKTDDSYEMSCDYLSGVYIDNTEYQSSNRTVLIISCVLLYAILILYFAFSNPEVFSANAKNS